MDNAELSTNVTATGHFHGMDAHHKKALFSNQSNGDSGNWSMSCSNVNASTSGLGSLIKSSVSKRSIDLETISENIEPKDDLQETPTTRNIRHLSAFHINTPQNAHNQIETTPTKANYFSLYDSGSRSSSKKNRSQNIIRWPSNKSSPRRLSSQRKSFSTQIFESIDENYENHFINEDANPCDQSIGVSPIKPVNNSMLVVKQPEKVQELQRHPSGIESSTPKNSFRRTRTQSIVKAKPNDSNENFSPAKRTALRETNFQNSFVSHDESVDIEKRPDNPARKILAFNPQTFGKLINDNFQFNQPETVSNNVSGHMDVDNSPSPKCSPLKRYEPYKSSRLVREFSRKKSMKTVISTPTKAVKTLNESDILKSLATANVTDSQKYEDKVMNISNSEMLTPSTNVQLKTVRNDTPIQNNFVKQNICDGANRTPIKRFEKYSSYNCIPPKSSPEKEKFNIVYRHLPCTPPKKYPRRHLKRTLATRDDSPVPSAPSAKRKLYSICPRPSFYNGLEQLDILTQLKKFEMINVIEKILKDLPDEGLQAASSVCTSWKSFVDGNRELRSRRRRFVRKMQMIKENVNRDGSKLIISNTNNNNNNNNSTQIKPLHRHNSNCETEEKPISVSPSTQRFNAHQRMVKALKPEQRILHCPNCTGPSIVHPETMVDAKVQRKSPRRRMLILPDKSLRSSIGATIKTKTNIGLTKIVASEYAVCSKKACGFEFCTNCNGNRHVNGKCTKRPLGSSPKSDEDSSEKPHHRSTKRRLRRLVF